MESSGDCTSPYTDASSSFLAMLQEVEPRVARRRLSQARHRAKLVGLFNHLRDTVCPQSKRTKRTTSKWQVLRKAKNYILDLERKLENLLKLKEAYHLEDGHPSNLEEIKEQYINYYKEHWYLNFYKETVDLLVENRIVSMEQITLPIVSKAISHLWQEMSGEKKEAIFKKCSQRSSVCLSPGEQITLQIPMQMDCTVRDRALDSQGASGSSESNHDEMLFEDAFDLASGFLVKSELNTRTGIKRESSSIFSHCSSENPEETCILYKQIINFVMARPGTVAHHSQISKKYEETEDFAAPKLATEGCQISADSIKGIEIQTSKRCAPRALPGKIWNSTGSTESSPNVDDETVLLRCTETFDDDL
ncbi:stimulated by retinoic acid gene 8 protein homolog [Scyliorhinus torazame]|uniref:stimulated by retinoic acid gene 8 protein homolog n=1 Tax=Scyliorhinus torazame TaxID=75743 RepID=UPI003B5BABB3